ncbi:MAG: Sortase [Patescibacteria group bacterium]|nr:Sortase [Patescibacteria group bacterium]
MDPRNNRASTSDESSSQRDAAARLVRDQLDAIYNQDPKITTPSGKVSHSARPQHVKRPEQQHTSSQHTAADPHATAQHMKQYHNQWQQYYQRYYENYYVGHLHNALEKEKKARQTPEEAHQEEMAAMRQKILNKAKSSAKKARKSRHFVPVMSAVIAVVVVAFLQYNQIIIANVQAYVSPGAIDPQNIVIDPNASTQVSSDPRLIIPKINVDVPVIYNVGYDHNSQMAAMQKGVAHFAIPGANSVPGQLGNTVFSGHSSNDLFDPGDYKFIFAQLDKLQLGDTIYVHYNSTRYTYTVTKKEVVKPTNVNALLGMDNKPNLTLITCTPLGTATNRLLVKAEQVAPDPTKAKSPDAIAANGKAVMAGNGPTALERLFGAR